MYHVTNGVRRHRAPAPAAILLLALCLFLVGTGQAAAGPKETTALADANATYAQMSALAPYPGTHDVPGLVQAKDYDLGGEGVAYHDTEPANLGGAYRPAEGVDIETSGLFTDVGWIRDGEWLTYTVNATEPQEFVVWFRAANPDATAKRVAILADGVPAGTVDLRPTGSFDGYMDSNSTPISLPAGETAIRLSFEGVSRVNLLEFDFQLANPPEPTPVPTPAPELLVSTPGLHTLDRDLSSDHIGVMITSSDVVFDGMGHSIEGTDANDSMGVYATGPSFTPITNVTVRNLTVRHWADGIRFAMVSGSVVEDVVAEQNGVGLTYRPTSGITDDHVIRDSIFRNNGAGISLDYPAEGIAIERCQVTGNGDGLVAFDSGRFDGAADRITDSDFSENTDHGLFIDGGHFSGIDNCTIRGNGGDGLRISASRTNITGNRVENNSGTGVNAGDRSSSTITGNWIAGNGIGVQTDTEFGFLLWNNMLNNTVNGGISNLAGSGTLTSPKTPGPNIVGGPFIGGNFWANPNGTGFSQTHPDLNQDGFCDEPYVLGESTTDFLPLAPAPTGTPNVSTPYNPHSIPGRVEAEDYDVGGEGVAYHDTTPGNLGGAYRHDDVDIEKLAGLATPDVGWIRNGEYLLYTVNVTTAGRYDMTASMASPNDGPDVRVFLDELQVNDLPVPNTGSFETFRTVTTTIFLTTGTHTLRLAFSGDGLNLDWFALTPQAESFTHLEIPGTIQAEDYDIGGEGITYHDTTPGNLGGAYRHDDVDIETSGGVTDVGWIRTGEYLTYTVYITEDGNYDLTARVASPNSGRTAVLSVDGGPVATIAVPNTGSFETFRTVSVPVTLASAYHTLKLTFSGDGQNIDWIAFAPAGVTTPTPTPTPTPGAGGASFVAVPATAPYGSAVKFTLTPASGKSVSAALWSFDVPAHLNTWNSRTINPTFFYPAKGTFSPQVKITYTDGSSETVQRTGYIHAT